MKENKVTVEEPELQTTVKLGKILMEQVNGQDSIQYDPHADALFWVSKQNEYIETVDLNFAQIIELLHFRDRFKHAIEWKMKSMTMNELIQLEAEAADVEEAIKNAQDI